MAKLITFSRHERIIQYMKSRIKSLEIDQEVELNYFVSDVCLTLKVHKYEVNEVIEILEGIQLIDIVDKNSKKYIRKVGELIKEKIADDNDKYIDDILHSKPVSDIPDESTSTTKER